MAKREKLFPKVEAGEWVKPKRRYYLMGCCDCGLVHKLEFQLRDVNGGKGIFMRAWRDETATDELRRKDRK